MADSNSVAINITGQDTLTPALRQMQQALTQIAERGITDFARRVEAAGNSQQKLADAIVMGTQLLQQFGATTNAAGQAVDKFGQSLGRDATERLRDLQAELQGAQRQLQILTQYGINAGEAARTVGTFWQQAFAVGAGLGIATSIQALVSQLASSAKAAVTTAVTFEQLRLSTTAVTGSQVEGARALAFTRDLAQRLGVNMLSLTDAYKNFAAATRGTTLEGDGTRRVFENIVTAGRAMGSSNDQIRHGLLALEQMVSKGCFDPETEVYTTRGWVYWPDVQMDDKFYSCDPLNPTYIEPQPAQQFIRFRHQLPMLQIANAHLNLCVTLGHWMLVQETEESPWKFVMAMGLTTHPYWIRTLQGIVQVTPQDCTLIEDYDDEVFCVEVPFHTLLVRRHGKTAWIGQTVSMEELRRQLGNALPGAFQVAARGMGVTTAELEKMIKTGTVDAIPFVMKLGEQFRKELGEGAVTAAQSADAAFARFANNMRDLSGSAGNAILTILKPFVDFLNKGFELYNKAAAQAERERQQREAVLEPGLQWPRGVPMPPDIAARQREIENLSRQGMPTLLDPMTGLPGLPGGLPREQETRLRELKQQQDRAVQAWLDRVQHPPEELGATDELSQMSISFTTLRAAVVRIRKTLESQLVRQDVLGGIGGMPATLEQQTETAKERLQLISQALDEIRKQINIPEGATQISLPTDIALQIEALRLRYAEEEVAIARLEDIKANARQEQKDADQSEADRLHARESVAKREVEARRQEERRAAEEKEALQKALGDEEKRLLEAEAKGIEDIEQARKRAYDTRLRQTQTYSDALDRLLAQLSGRRQERRIIGLEMDMPEGLSPEQQAALVAKQQLARQKIAENEQAERARRLFTTIGGELQGAFESIWTAIFDIGSSKAQNFGIILAQILQRTVVQASTQVMSSLLNQLVPPDKEGLNIWGQVAKGFISVAGSAFGGGGGGASFTGTENAPSFITAQGGIVPALRAIQPIAMAYGGIVDRPSFGILGENGPREPEAVIPMPNGRVPVHLTGGGQQAPFQNVIFELHVSFKDAIDPRMLRRSDGEIVNVVARDITRDGVMRRVIVQHAR